MLLHDLGIGGVHDCRPPPSIQLDKQPAVFRNARSRHESAVGEHEFLEAFLTKDLPEGILLQPVEGAPGAGKSHLIRWLAAQLERDARAKRMVVVRIPKTASHHLAAAATILRPVVARYMVLQVS